MHFLGNVDWNGFNCGVFMMRMNEWGINFLTQATALPLLKPDVPLGFNKEQDAMRWVLAQEGYKEHAVYQPRQWYNSFARGVEDELETKEGDLLIHFAGVSDKYSLMGHWLDIVENEPEKVNIPLDNLTLHEDIKGFWNNLRAAKQVLHNTSDFMEKDIAQRVFEQYPELRDDLVENSRILERLMYEDPFQQQEFKEATLLADTALNRAFKATAKVEKHDYEEAEMINQAEAEEEDRREKKANEKNGTVSKVATSEAEGAAG